MRMLVVGIVLLHLAISIPHGMAHSRLGIQMEAWQNAYILQVITILPLIAAVMVWLRPRIGFVLLTISMAGSLLFGIYYHFLVAGPDNVALVMNLDSFHHQDATFKWTAILLTASEFAGTVIGIVGLKSDSHES